MTTRKYNQNTLILGQHNDLCDVCGFKFKSGELRKRWDGLTVCYDDWEPRHPSDFFRVPSERVEAGGSDDSGQQAVGANTDYEGSVFPPAENTTATGQGTQPDADGDGLPESTFGEAVSGTVSKHTE